MLIPKEISTPLRTITLMVDDSKPITKKDNRLIEVLVEYHNVEFDLRVHVKDMLEKFIPYSKTSTETYKEYEHVLVLLNELSINTKKLLDKKDDFSTFLKEYDIFYEAIKQFNEKSRAFGDSFFEMKRDLLKIWDLRDISEQKIMTANSSFELLLTVKQDFFINTNEYAVNLDSFLKETSLVFEITETIESEKKEALSLYDNYVNHEFNPWAESFNKGFPELPMLSKIITEVHTTYTFYTKAKEFDSYEIFFELYVDKTIEPTLEVVYYGVSYDIEFGKNGGIILHLDTEMVIPDVLNSALRKSYRIKCSLEELFTANIMEPLIWNGLIYMRNDMTERHEKGEHKIDMDAIEISAHVVENLTKTFLEGDEKAGTKIAHDDDLHQPILSIKTPGFFSLLSIVVINVFTQLLYSNKNFDNRFNRHAVKNIFSDCHFQTMRNLFWKMHEKEVILNLKYFFLFFSLVDATCQLLVGDHAEDFYEDLLKSNITPENRILFLKEAQKHYKDAIEFLEKNNIEAPFLKKTRDWNRVFF